MPATLDSTEVAELLGMTTGTFNRRLTGLIKSEGFPPPYIGALQGRSGPRRRWLQAAVIDWIKTRSQAITAPLPAAANDTEQTPREATRHHGHPESKISKIIRTP